MGIPVFFASHNPSRSLPSPRPVVRARKPNSLALPAGGREPNLSPGCFSASSRSRVRARKPNLLALPAGGREPNLSPGCFSASFRSRVRARKPNSLALPAGGREPNQSAEPVLAWPDEGTRACGSKAPTGKAARSDNGASVGVARRRRKGLQGSRRQHGRPRAGKKAPGLAWPDEGARACREQGANIEGRALEKRRRGWRSPTVEQGLAGCKAPTWKAARRFSRRIVGAVQRRSKGLGGARRQQGRSRAGKKAPGLAWPDEGTRACGMQGANREGRALRKRRRGNGAGVGVARRRSKGLGGARRQHGRPRGRNRNRKRAAAAALFVLLTSVVLFRQKCSFQ